MKRILLILAILAIAGCAANAKTEVKHGKKGMHINCSGLSSSWNKCYAKAASSCGTKGYKVVAKSGDGEDEPGTTLRSQPRRLHQPKHDRHLQVTKRATRRLPFSCARSDSFGSLFQPVQSSTCQQWRKPFTHRAVVIIEPFAFFAAQLLRQQASCVDRAQGQRFEFKKVTKPTLARIPGEHQVLDAHAPLPRPIGARLVGGDHAGLHGCVRRRRGLIGDHLWPFVHVHEVADAVAGAMPVIHMLGP